MPALHVPACRVGDCVECGSPIHDIDLARRCPSCGVRHDPEDPTGLVTTGEPDLALMAGFDDYMEDDS